MRAGSGRAFGKLEREFLPAALEIEETPASPVGRIGLWSIVMFFVIAMTWATVGKVDIVAVAHGRIVPAGHVKVVQPVEIGVIERILVEEGERVASGQLLVALDETLAAADEERLEKEMAALSLDRARVEVLLRSIREGTSPPSMRASGRAPASLAGLQQARLEREYGEHRAHLADFRQRERQNRAELAATRAGIERLNSIIPLVTEQARALEILLGKEMVSRHEWASRERDRIEQVKEREILGRQLERLEAVRASMRETRAVYEAQLETRLLAELSDVTTRLSVLEKELEKAKRRRALTRLTAPVAGVVHRLRVHTAGGVVSPAQELMVVVPDGASLVAEVGVENKDIGFVREGQPVEIKVDAFPFTKYGTLPAEIVSLSSDAISDERFGLVYTARIALADTSIDVDGGRATLAPGMSVTAEIKTGQRRLIEFVLSPLLRYRHESARER